MSFFAALRLRARCFAFDFGLRFASLIFFLPLSFPNVDRILPEPFKQRGAERDFCPGIILALKVIVQVRLQRLSSRLLKNPTFTLRQCFGKLSRALRAKVGSIETIYFYPFVVSLSNHSKYFFNSLPGRTAARIYFLQPKAALRGVDGKVG